MTRHQSRNRKETYGNCTAAHEILGDTRSSYWEGIGLHWRTAVRRRLWEVAGKKITPQKNRNIYKPKLMSDNKTNYAITLAVRDFLKFSRRLLTLDPISSVTDHREFLATTGKSETPVAG